MLRNKQTSEAIGDAGIMHLEGTDYIELGFRISRRFWRAGFATEAAGAIMRHASETLGIQKLHAIVEPENTISIHVIEDKLDFGFTGQEVLFGMQMNLYCKDIRDLGVGDLRSQVSPLP